MKLIIIKIPNDWYVVLASILWIFFEQHISSKT